MSSVSLTTDGYVPEDGSGCNVGIQHLPDLESVCVATGKLKVQDLGFVVLL